METRNTPTTMKIATILFLLWGIMGIVAFAFQATMDPATLAKTDPHQAHMMAAMPGWAWTAYGVAVFACALSALALVLRRLIAIPLSLLQIVAVVVQFGYAFLLTDLLAVKGAGAAIFPIVILVVALLQLAFARAMRRRGLLR